MILTTNSPYELILENMKNITTEISDEQNLALSINSTERLRYLQ
jgi:hypothetical protein